MVTVTMVVAIGFAGLTVKELGLKLQLLPPGNAEQAAELGVNVPVKPFREVIVRGIVPEVAPLGMFTTELVEDKLKSGAFEGADHPAALTRLKTLTDPRPVVRS
jgi:hypothetical protein